MVVVVVVVVTVCNFYTVFGMLVNFIQSQKSATEWHLCHLHLTFVFPDGPGLADPSPIFFLRLFQKRTSGIGGTRFYGCMFLLSPNQQY